MNGISRRRFLQLSAIAGGAMALGDWADQVLGLMPRPRLAYAAEPIKVGIIDPLSSPYKTSSIHDVHGATVALEMYNKRGGVLGRPVTIIEADDASNVQTALKAAGKLIKEGAQAVEGSGGGRPDLAQAGGKNPAGLDRALDIQSRLVADAAARPAS